jgi:hypothetical protein
MSKSRIILKHLTALRMGEYLEQSEISDLFTFAERILEARSTEKNEAVAILCDISSVFICIDDYFADKTYTKKCIEKFILFLGRMTDSQPKNPYTP